MRPFIIRDNMKNKKNDYYRTLIIFICFLGIIGILLFSRTNIYEINKIIEFKNYIHKYSFLLFLIILVLISTIIINYFITYYKLVKPKMEVMFLFKIEDNFGIFIDKKGIKYFFKNNNYIINKYYKVLVINKNIIEILDESNEIFDVPRIKLSYWSNFYILNINCRTFRAILFVYSILFLGLFLISLNGIYYNLYGIIQIFMALGLIIYDLIYKIKLYKNKNFVEINTDKMENNFHKYKIYIELMIFLILEIYLINIYLKIDNILIKIFIIPFLLYLFSKVGYLIAKLRNNELMIKIFNKLPRYIIISYVIFLFVMMIIIDYVFY